MTKTNGIPEENKWYIYRLGALIVIALTLVIHSIWLFLGDTEQFPINTIRIKAHYQCLNHKQLQTILEPHLHYSFVTLSLKKLQHDLQQHPCIKLASIKRSWPDKLIITLQEKKPLLRWNDALITEEGDLFTPYKTRDIPGLVQFNSVNAPQANTIKKYNNLSKILSDYGLSASIVNLSKNGDWEIVLNNSVVIYLGRQHIIKRITRFAKAYAALEAEQDTPPLSIDLRYSRGMAVKWSA